MKCEAIKRCDSCNEVVAIKKGLFYRTTKSHLTYYWDGTDDPHLGKSIFRDEAHICDSCWLRMKIKLREIKNG